MSYLLNYYDPPKLMYFNLVRMQINVMPTILPCVTLYIWLIMFHSTNRHFHVG